MPSLERNYCKKAKLSKEWLGRSLTYTPYQNNPKKSEGGGRFLLCFSLKVQKTKKLSIILESFG
ncbi:hypothetical protein [Helicobacter canadensis]|uniref:Uncharacterized protein n=1 Tax=Helicobacter canadensis MIT 98-5491 TaxID=537970 RepID=C5ZWK6_9HELI|nr:hypothetical protein [Helicobacter canadensis]EES89524.1 hypothetical protein HCAN_0810 [Helicobacter canadensis MIT 98-5491]EFR48315.1 hypothetical protein HCMG_00488 [Helicobacter canadensis MIT 98-5491]